MAMELAVGAAPFFELAVVFLVAAYVFEAR